MIGRADGMRHARAMRAVLLSALMLSTSIACAPPEAAEVPEHDEKPCVTDRDCEFAGRETGPRSQLCQTQGLSTSRGEGTGELNMARCGAMGNTKSPTLAEPELACFRGTCVAIGSSSR